MVSNTEECTWHKGAWTDAHHGSGSSPLPSDGRGIKGEGSSRDAMRKSQAHLKGKALFNRHLFNSILRQSCQLACAFTLLGMFSGCTQRWRDSLTPPDDTEAVPVALVHWDTLKESKEILDTIESHGVHAKPESEATVVFRIFVAKDRAAEALSILETNHLIMEGKVDLIEKQ